MKILRLMLIGIATFGASCEKSHQVRSVSLGRVNIPGVEMAFGGSSGDTLEFVVMPTFDWINGGGAGSGTGAGSSTGPDGAVWSGFHRDEKNHRWEYEVTETTARFGEQEFQLVDGEAFIMYSDFSVHQIPGSRAGSRDDETNLKRLAELFENSKSEQGGVERP